MMYYRKAVMLQAYMERMTAGGLHLKSVHFLSLQIFLYNLDKSEENSLILEHYFSSHSLLTI